MLDGKHSIFGEITGGMDVLKALEAAGSPSGATSERLTIDVSWIVVLPATATPKPASAEEPKKKEGK